MSKPSQTPRGACPICGKPGVEDFRPFCSKHCADVDLGRWMTGAYATPLVEADEEDEESLDSR